MNILLKVAAAMALLALLMTSGFYSYLKAEGDNTSTVSSADRTVASNTRTITGAIKQIDVSGPIELTLKQGSIPSLVVKGEQRHLSKITTEQNGDNLVISFSGSGFHSKTPIEVEVTVPMLEKLTVRGSGESHVTGFSGEQLQLALNGSGNVELKGEYQRVTANLRGSGDLNLSTGNSNSIDLDVIGSGSITAKGKSKALVTHLNGSGDIDADELLAENVTISLNGSGNTHVHATQSINVNLRGSGDVKIQGQPSQRTISKYGSGDVEFE